MQKYIYVLVTVFFTLFSGCNQGQATLVEKTKENKEYQIEIDSILSIYDTHANIYNELYLKALYGDKTALKSYSDLMLEVNVLDNKLEYLISQKKIASNQLKKYMNLKKKFMQ
ncbi:hypothetical protein LNQ81_08355 [Myroides sp. M-43]|uniref:hypothetical protein n=1 Tax=Myroides oncorhynchi TaxID=2893756 RepID=UPI001E2FE881|nr:hypothetical protein [Myroides oncorhynchi]MCC9042701.1 hypothetical protein [Myroides oncorhynchi]